MVTEITKGVKVSVKTSYQPAYSSPEQNHYVFTYKIIIENQSENTIQLLKRSWDIFDSNGLYREVKGDGVIGLQPTLEPGEKHDYVSGCQLQTSIGKMEGFYTFKRLIDGKTFDVTIPSFNLIVPYLYN